MFKKLLIPMDGSGHCVRTLGLLAGLPYRPGTEFHLLTVANGADGCHSLDSHVAMLESRGHSATAATRTGDPASAIVAYARESDAEGVVMVPHSRKGLSRLLHHSVTESVMRRVACPVIALNEQVLDNLSATDRFAVNRLLVPLDGSIGSTKALDLIRALAADDPVEVTLFHDELGIDESDNDGESAELRQVLFDHRKHLQGEGINTAVASTSFTHPAAAITDQASSMQADAILMASHCRKGVARGLFGSTAADVFQSAPCPVIVVRIDEPEEPDTVDPFVNG